MHGPASTARTALLLLFALVGCRADDSGADRAIPAHEPPRVVRAYAGMESPVAERGCAVVEDVEGLARHWRRLGRPADAVPQVDFARRVAVIVTHGEDRALEGMEARLGNDEGGLVLSYRLFTTSGRLSPIVRPWGVYVVPRTAEPIRVECRHTTGPGPAAVTTLGVVAASR